MRENKDYLITEKPSRALLIFSIPMIIGNLFQQAYTIVDSAIVGRYVGETALAAVGASYALTSIFICIAIGGGIGASVIISHHFGGHNYGRMKTGIRTALLSFLFISLILGGIGLIFSQQIMEVLNTPADAIDIAVTYLNIYFLGLPFLFMYNILSSMFNALGESRIPLYLLIFSSVLNIFLDLFCIIVLHWGCMGAAIATVTAQAVSAVLCLLFIKKKMPLLWLEKENRIMQRNTSAELLKMGLPTGFQFSITAIGSMVMQSANNGLGSICVSGFTAGMRIKQFTMCPFDAFGTAASVFCSQNLGAGKADRIKKGFWEGISVAVLYGLFAGVILVFLGRPLSMIFIKKDAGEVLDASAKYLRCMGYFYWSLGILNVARMVTQGLGYSGRAVFSGVTEMIARTVVSLGFVGTYGYTAICFADQTAWVSACIYIVPTCILCMKKSIKMLEKRETLREA